MTLGACVELFFGDLGYVDRIRMLHSLGFRSYEFWFHDKHFDGRQIVDLPKPIDEIAELNQSLGMSVTSFVFNHTEGGIVASLVDPKDRSKMLDGLGEIIAIATKLNCRSLICTSGPSLSDVRPQAMIDVMVESLQQLGGRCARHGIDLLLEPFNTKVDHPGNFLDDPDVCIRVLEAVAMPNVKMLFDIYHMQIMRGDIVSFIRHHHSRIGHFHIAGVPGRHEPATCELNYGFIVQEALRAGYVGAFGLEYFPSKSDEESLKETLSMFQQTGHA